MRDPDASQNWPMESLKGRLARRVVSIPALATGSILGVVVGLCLLPLACVADLITGPTRLRFCRVLGMLVLLCGVHLVYLPMVMGAGPIAWIFPNQGLHIDRWLQRTWAASLLKGTCWMLGMQLGDGEGDLPDPEEPVLVFSRHVSVLDVLVPMIYVAGHGHPRMRYVLKSALKGNPLIDLVGQRLPNAFIDRSQSEASRAAVRRLGEGLGPAGGVVIYPEGTRATPARRVKALARLEASDRPVDLERAKALRHLLPPRPAGVLELLEQSPDAQVCFLGHVGMERFTRATDMIGGRLYGQRIQVRRWVVPRDEVPGEKEARVEWLWQAWERMDQWIENQGSRDDG